MERSAAATVRTVSADEQPGEAPVTPMIRQYLDAKARAGDAFLFFRLGDFYELFFEDAVQAAELLGITLTARSKGAERVPMCGVPFHAARRYLAKLLDAGHKVAICEQVEAPGSGRASSAGRSSASSPRAPCWTRKCSTPPAPPGWSR